MLKKEKKEKTDKAKQFLKNLMGSEFEKYIGTQLAGDFVFKLVKKIKPYMVNTKKDIVNHPLHYQGYKKEVIEIIEYTLGVEGFKSYCEGNEIKYRLRAGDKTENWKEDIEKALWYKNAKNNVKRKPDIIEQEEVDTLLNKLDEKHRGMLSIIEIEQEEDDNMANPYLSRNKYTLYN